MTWREKIFSPNRGTSETENRLSNDPNFLCLSLCGEAGELANLLKKRWRGDAVDPARIREEMADVRMFLELLAKVEGVDLEAACEEKILAVETRWRKARKESRNA
jgi:NTP pyrophosphatase (non-canonical NTP hydrolase)